MSMQSLKKIYQKLQVEFVKEALKDGRKDGQTLKISKFLEGIT